MTLTNVDVELWYVSCKLPFAQCWHWWFRASLTLGLKHFRSHDQLLWRDTGRAHTNVLIGVDTHTHTHKIVRPNASSDTPDGYRYTVKSRPRLKPGRQWCDSVCCKNPSRRPRVPLGSATDFHQPTTFPPLLHCFMISMWLGAFKVFFSSILFFLSEWVSVVTDRLTPADFKCINKTTGSNFKCWFGKTEKIMPSR